MVKGSFGGAALEELTRMVKDLQIAQARRDGGEQAHEQWPLAGNRCMWCDAVGHILKDCGCHEYIDIMASPGLEPKTL